MDYSMLKHCLLMAALFFFACGSEHGEHQHGEDAAHSEVPADTKPGPEYTSDYVCPMHCPGSGSAEAGKCPVCDMDYIARSEHEANSHSHH